VEEIDGALDIVGFEVHSIFRYNEAIYKSPHNNRPEDFAGDWTARLERAVSL
jgi:hypothetical protein